MAVGELHLGLHESATEDSSQAFGQTASAPNSPCYILHLPQDTFLSGILTHATTKVDSKRIVPLGQLGRTQVHERLRRTRPTMLLPRHKPLPWTLVMQTRIWRQGRPWVPLLSSSHGLGNDE